MRGLVWVLAAAGALQAAELPAWWTALSRLPRLESGFVQESESAVFGSLRKEGSIQLAKGGRIRVAYRAGVTLVADGATLVQYDPQARTAQRFSLRSARQDMPLLNLLVDPAALAEVYQIKASRGDQVLLEPKRKGLPQITVEGAGGFLKRVSWTDATGAAQTLVLTDPHIPGTAFPSAGFTFKAPAGTRWIE